jgi:hypothetical protein
MDEPTANAGEPGWVASALAMLRLMAGWAATGLAVLNLSMGVDTGPGSTDGPYLVFHAVLLITGLTLLALGALHKRPGRTAYLAGAGVGGAGLLISALAHGFPFPLVLGRHLIADLAFWACVGLFALVVVTQLRPAPAVEPIVPEVHRATHAEQRAPAPHDENVGGLP